MIYFQDWWSYGENCIIETYKGVLAGDKKFNDICIFEKEMLNIFIDSIAKEITIDAGKNRQITKSNKDDVFLSGKINIDFRKNILFVFSEANIKEIVYSKMFECYLITYSEEPAETNTYFAVIAKKIYPPENDYYMVNDAKKEEDNESEELNINKEGNKGQDNDFKLNNISKVFNPKFETMNDKPKPIKGNLMKSYNDDY
jgi:hypothetical protein